jgi:hypothetical protein
MHVVGTLPPVLPPPVLLELLAPVEALVEGPPPEPVALVLDGPLLVALPTVPLDCCNSTVDWQEAKVKRREAAQARRRRKAMRALQRQRAGFATGSERRSLGLPAGRR